MADAFHFAPKWRRMAFLLFSYAGLLSGLLTTAMATADEGLQLHFRSRISTAGEGATIKDKAQGTWKLLEKTENWNPKQTAIVICDMWDRHWCQNATQRVGEMASRMNEVVRLARERGVLIIHCPSDTMEFYKDFPQRKLAQAAPVVEAPRALARWCHIDPEREPPLPIDDSQGGCDDEPVPASFRAWKKQHADLEIDPHDAITDSAEAYYLMRQRGIKNVIVMGVHTNMCVLGRPFSIRQLKYQGMNVALMRDMTDAMYDPEAVPHVSHSRGTDLVVEHIEKYWCPTLLSSDFTGKPPLAFSDDKRPHVVFLIGEDEYQTEKTLPQFAADELASRGLRCTFVHAADSEKNSFPLISDIDSADLLFISVRRRLPSQRELDVVRKYVQSGKPIVALRTASHAFASKSDASVLPTGQSAWPTFDSQVLGAKYEGHYGKAKSGPSSWVWSNPDAKHPLTTEFPMEELPSASWLYKYQDLVPDTHVLLWGRPAGEEAQQPAAWVRSKGPRVFYTMLGHPEDFEVPAFRDLLRRAVEWGLEK